MRKDKTIYCLNKIINITNKIDGWLSVKEGLLLYLLASQVQEGEIVEIGSWKGKSTIFLGMGARVKNLVKVFAVDPHKGCYGQKSLNKNLSTLDEFNRNISKAGLKDIVVPVVKTSEQAERVWKRPIGLLFIDGLHDYFNSKLDFCRWSSHLKNGGLVALHDAFCGYSGPRKVINEFIFKNDEYVGIGVVGSIIFARRIKNPTGLDKIIKYFRICLINFVERVNKNKLFPSTFRVFIIHRLIKILLINLTVIKVQLLRIYAK